MRGCLYILLMYLVLYEKIKLGMRYYGGLQASSLVVRLIFHLEVLSMLGTKMISSGHLKRPTVIETSATKNEWPGIQQDEIS